MNLDRFGDILDMLGALPGSNTSAPTSSPVPSNLPPLVTAVDGDGLAVNGQMVLQGGKPVMQMSFSNSSATPVASVALQINKNAFGLLPENTQVQFASPIMNGSGTSQNLPLKCSPQNLVMENPTLTVKAAMLNPATNKVNYFDLPIAMEALFANVPAMEVQVLVDGWKSVPDDQYPSLHC